MDEVLEGEALYRLIDKDGNIILDDLRIEQITPAVQVGTPINKVLFDSIKKDFDDTKEFINDLNTYIEATALPDSITAGKNILSYSNGLDLNTKNRIVRFTVKDSTANATNIIPVLSSKEEKGYKVWSEFSASSDSAYDEQRAFDGDASTFARSSGIAYEAIWYLIIKLPTTVKPSKISITGSNIRTNSLIQASVDGSTWDTLYTFTSHLGISSSETSTFNVNANKYYKYYRFAGRPFNVNSNIAVYDFQITNGERTIFDSNLPTMLNDKNIIQKTSEPSIFIGEKYEAVFDGTNFVLRNNVTESDIETIKSAIVALGGIV